MLKANLSEPKPKTKNVAWESIWNYRVFRFLSSYFGAVLHWMISITVLILLLNI